MHVTSSPWIIFPVFLSDGSQRPGSARPRYPEPLDRVLTKHHQQTAVRTER